MTQYDQSMMTSGPRTTDLAISRRSAVGSSSLAVLSLMSVYALGQTEKKEDEPKRPRATLPKEMQERMEQSKAFSERLRNASGIEERQQIVNEQMAAQRQRAFEELKDHLQVSEKEWPVVKPRLQAVYDLVRPVRPMMGRNEQPQTEVEQRTRELREVLQGDNPPLDQIKAKLTALRAARERANQNVAQARQNLREIMNLRQEAVLVLNGLLD
jgi:DNA repair exonuclease SbcCD ATPase subunit